MHCSFFPFTVFNLPIMVQNRRLNCYSPITMLNNLVITQSTNMTTRQPKIPNTIIIFSILPFT